MPSHEVAVDMQLLRNPITPAHEGIAPNEHTLRVLLGAPADLPLVQWRFSVSDDRRLAGCVWEVVGTLVPWTVDRPDYLHIDHVLPQQSSRLQAWLWRVYKPPLLPDSALRPLGWNRPYGDLRWHPEHGWWRVIELRPSDGLDVAKRVWNWLHISRLYAGGRPEGSGDRPPKEELIRQVQNANRQIREGGNVPTYKTTWQQMGRYGTGSTLKKWLTHYHLRLKAL